MCLKRVRLHLRDGDNAAEEPDHAEELRGVVDADRVLQPHQRHARQHRPAQRQHVPDQPVLA